MLFILGIIGIALGAMYLFNKDAAWQMSARRYRVMGLSPERTVAWDASANFQGGLLIVVGLILVGFGFATYSEAHRSPMSGSYLNGRQLTVDEERRFNRDPGAFLTQNCIEHPEDCRTTPPQPPATSSPPHTGL